MPDESGNLRFEVDARHVLQLGRELVADKVTAVSELVKNSYDADATEVSVDFEVTSEATTLTVIDNGEGMSFDEVRERWMRISTPFKDEHSTSSRYCRKRAGQKGIGRFAVETLGRRLELSSTKRGSTDRLEMSFDWSLYGSGGTDISAVENPFQLVRAGAEEHGTVLRIVGLHEDWRDRDLRSVRRAVLLLQPPFPVRDVVGDADSGCEPDPGFSVEVKSDLSADADITTLDSLRHAATAVVQGVVNEYGRIELQLTSDRFNLERFRRPDNRVMLTGGFSFKAYYYIWSTEALGELGSLTQADARRLANEFGGIRLYRDGLRILPYGERRDDWLGLDALYRQRGRVLYPIAKNNFFGEVHVTRDENPSLIDTASREGVIEGAAFHELRDCVRDGLLWAAGEIASAREKKPSARKTRKAPVSRSELVTRLVQSGERLADAARQGRYDEALDDFRGTAQRALDSASASDEEEAQERATLVDEVSLLRILASLGASMAVFSHEVRGAITTATAAIDDLAETGKDSDGVPSGYVSDNLERAVTSIANLRDIGEYIDSYVSQSRRRSRSPLPVKEVVRDFVDRLQSVFSRAEINVAYSVEPAHLRTVAMARSEYEAILFNLVTNAMKALDREGLTNRRIKIIASERDGMVALALLDTGGGIASEVAGRMFEPFVTTSRLSDSPELGVGTGLGLKIVSDIAQAHGGRVGVGAAEAPFVTCIEVLIPKGQLDD